VTRSTKNYAGYVWPVHARRVLCHCGGDAVEITERDFVDVWNEYVLMDIVTTKCSVCDFRRAVDSSRWPVHGGVEV
jgi:hypothetical protein